MTDASHDAIAALRGALAEGRATLLAAAAAVPEDTRGRAPAPGAWSARDVLEHLARSEAGTARVMGRLVREAGAHAVAHPDASRVLRALDHFELLAPDARAAAPDFTRPVGEGSWDELLGRLAESRAALLARLEDSRGRALEGVTFPHPSLGPLDLHAWALFVAQHETRHAAQLRRIAAARP